MSRPRIRRLFGVLLAGIFAGIFSAGITTPAHALDLCVDPPPPIPPKHGLPGLVTVTPDRPSSGDPFADPRIPISDVYGTAWQWGLYDLGCTPNALSDPQAVFNTTQGNQVMAVAAANIAVLGTLEQVATDTGVGWFGDWTGQVAETIAPIILGGTTPNGVALGLLPMAAIVAGGWLAWKARKANYAATFRVAVVFVACVCLAGFCLVYPGLASRAVDSAVRQTAAVAGSSFNASLTDGANRNSLYRAWLAGQFGDPDSALARDHGPALMDATHYTWAEWARIQADPAAREGIDEAKGDEFKRIADAVKEASPSAYATFQGRGERVGAASFGLVASLVMSLFALIAFFMILIARIMMQVLVIAAPVAAVLGLLPSGDAALMRMWDLLTASVWAVFKFTLAAGAMATVLGLLSTLDQPTALLWMLVVTVAALMMLKPMRAFKTIMPGMDPNRSYLRDLGGLLAKAAVTGAVTGATGGAVVAAAQAADRTDPAQPDPAPAAQPAAADTAPRERVDLTAYPAVPAPRWEQIPGTSRYRAVEAPPAPEPRLALEAGPSTWAGVAPQGTALPPAGPVPALPAGPAPATTPPPERPAESPPRDAPAGEVGSVVLEGEIVDAGPTGTYQRPEPADIVDAEIIPMSDLTRDRGTDQPSNELVLYQSAKAS